MDKAKNMGIAALVLGIVSCAFCWSGIVSILFLACGIVGIVLAVKAKKEYEAAGQKAPGMVTAGLVLSIIGVALCAILFLTVGLAAACVGCAACSAAGLI